MQRALQERTKSQPLDQQIGSSSTGIDWRSKPGRTAFSRALLAGFMLAFLVVFLVGPVAGLLLAFLLVFLAALWVSFAVAFV